MRMPLPEFTTLIFAIHAIYIYIAIEIVTKILELRTYWPCDTQIQPVFLHIDLSLDAKQ